ncbi:MAG: methyltransferase domain-containing protein [Acidiphilium sp.]|jgi:SAM-dependent methyltransferase|nr:methyltransferase domain-containing protein [Acidiphilium sp.]MDD4937287.1 methyltransferase domain-containing protein [Acidiphilium sp.]
MITANKVFDTIEKKRKSNPFSNMDIAKLSLKYGVHQFDDESSPVDAICSLIETAKLTSEDVAFDLGSGFGHFALTLSALSPARVFGIEIIQERVDLACAAARELELENVQFICDNVLEQDISSGTFFFCFNSFFEKTRCKIFSVLEELASKKKFSIAVTTDMLHVGTLPSWLCFVADIKSSSRLGYKIKLFKSVG